MGGKKQGVCGGGMVDGLQLGLEVHSLFQSLLLPLLSPALPN